MSNIEYNQSVVKQICNYLFYVPSRFVESISDSVNLYEGYDFFKINCTSIFDIDEKMSDENGIQFISQFIKFKVNSNVLPSLNDHYIVIVPYSDDTYKLLGSVLPYIPCTLGIKKGEGSYFQFSCQATDFAQNILYTA